MVTETQKTAFNIRVKKLQSGDKVVMGQVMKEAGYSDEMSKHPGVLVKSKGWQELIEKYDAEPVMDNVHNIAKGKEDKRTALQAARLFFEITGRLNTKIKIDINKQREELFD